MLTRITALLLLAALSLPLYAGAATVSLPRTGQTTSYGTRDDGQLKMGAAWPSPRFKDNGNGSVTDNLTGLVWLKDANCFGAVNWNTALDSANGLASGACGLSDGSTAGKWRLPNITELESLVDTQNYGPPLPAGQPFSNVQAHYYWSSSIYASYTALAWVVGMVRGNVFSDYKNEGLYVWPVRSGVNCENLLN